jgi:RNA polymerase sigma-70 factor (ECF subfamily)
MSVTVQAQVLNAAVRGDEASLGVVLDAVTPSIERQLLRYPVSDEDRRDLLQSTRLQIVRQIRTFRAESSFSTWLFRVTANEALMLMRSRRRHRARFVEGLEWEELSALASTWGADAPEHQDDLGLGARRRDARVRDAIGELPAEYKDVVVAHYHMDLGLHEIADRLSITESAVRSRLHRARNRLRTLLVAEHESAMSAAA